MGISHHHFVGGKVTLMRPADMTDRQLEREADRRQSRKQKDSLCRLLWIDVRTASHCYLKGLRDVT